MNGFVPVLIAVLLAEVGPRAVLYADARARDVAIWLIAVSTVAAAIAGGVIAPSLTGWADAFLIAIALGFAALGQVHRVKPAAGSIPVAIAFWRGGVPLIAFAFAARFGAAVVAAGALGGLVAAAVLTRAVDAPVRPIRRAVAGLLAVAAAAVASSALRLV